MNEPFPAPVTLETDRLTLRPPTAEDVDALTAACQDPEIQRWTVVPSPYRRADAEFFVEKLAAPGWAQGSATWCVVERTTGELVGTQALSHRGPGRAEIGYWATAGARGRGLTLEAVREVCRWGFAERGLRRIDWTAYVGNEPSHRLAVKAGFTVEGVLRSWAEQRGVFHDVWMGSLLAGEAGLPG
ncbi:GNAT family N-acetyltransferase [Kitasatospora sp. NPDC006697]|uniref:GNAT family N-acetyltransferase n=1 Tax=Kitasatospora sp. NPDC006697 TaxID=3364020 RepID=UPI003677FCD8